VNEHWERRRCGYSVFPIKSVIKNKISGLCPSPVSLICRFR
jgi:hypothetical protein